MTDVKKVMHGYVISILAFLPFSGAAAQVSGAKGEEDGNLYYNEPGILFAESMEHAAVLAREQAMAKWPPQDGFIKHRAAILPITKQEYDTIVKGLWTASLSTVEEVPQEFKFYYDA